MITIGISEQENSIIQFVEGFHFLILNGTNYYFEDDLPDTTGLENEQKIKLEIRKNKDEIKSFILTAIT